MDLSEAYWDREWQVGETLRPISRPVLAAVLLLDIPEIRQQAGKAGGGRKGKLGPRSDNRRFLDALLRMARLRGSLADLPDEFGDCEAVKRLPRPVWIAARSRPRSAWPSPTQSPRPGFREMSRRRPSTMPWVDRFSGWPSPAEGCFFHGDEEFGVYHPQAGETVVGE